MFCERSGAAAASFLRDIHSKIVMIKKGLVLGLNEKYFIYAVCQPNVLRPGDIYTYSYTSLL